MLSPSPDDVARTLADELRKRRIDAGLTQAELAKRAGFRWARIIQRLERYERDCNMRQLTAIATVLEMPPWKILKAAEDRAAAGDVPELPAAVKDLRAAGGLDG